MSERKDTIRSMTADHDRLPQRECRGAMWKSEPSTGCALGRGKIVGAGYRIDLVERRSIRYRGQRLMVEGK